MDEGEVAGVADAILRAAGYEDDDVPSALRLAERLLGAGCVVRVPGGGVGAPAALAWLHGQPVIQLRGRMSPETARFLVLHELAEWWLGRGGYDGQDVEQACDAIAAALTTPRRAFRSAVASVGESYARLARAFTTTESVVALRVGEVLHEPVALVTPRNVHARGPEWGWPDAETVRRVARTGRPGLRRVRLGDDPRRVVLRPTA